MRELVTMPEDCCKVAVIYLALNALKYFRFLLNDCFSAENADFLLLKATKNCDLHFQKCF
jgi:hypothetical protein